jgi:hypothetical protein
MRAVFGRRGFPGASRPACTRELHARALYAPYGVDWNTTYLLIEGGQAYTASAGYLRFCAVLGGAWHLLWAIAVIPERA